MPKYRVLSGKYHRIEDDGRKIYRPGDILEALEGELDSFDNRFERLNPPPKETPNPKWGLKAVHRGGGKYNVINEQTGLPINNALLTKEEAGRFVDEGLDPSEDMAE